MVFESVTHGQTRIETNDKKTKTRTGVKDIESGWSGTETETVVFACARVCVFVRVDV